MLASARIAPEEAKQLLDSCLGYVYLDVRSVPEFNAGHLPGAHCIPVLEPAAGGFMAPNEQFLQMVTERFGKDTPIIVGCQHGVRSGRAAQILAAAGFTNISDMPDGYPAWRDLGFPVTTLADSSH